MPFRSLISEGGELVHIGKTKHKKLTSDERGCEFCSLDGVEGVNKIIGKMWGRDILVVAQSPGWEENERDPPKELVGPSGKFAWIELRAVGIERADCDVFNVVKCIPVDEVGTRLRMRGPSKKEIHCCSLYTDQHMEKCKAKQILIFGQVAAKALLGLRSMPEAKTFWHEPFKARVYLLDHPSFFLHQNLKPGTKQSTPRLDQFRSILRRVAADRGKVNGQSAVLEDEYAFIKGRKYIAVCNAKAAVASLGVIRGYTGRGLRAAVDIEADDYPGGRHVFAIGVSPKPGLSYCFVLRHPNQRPEDGAAVRTHIKEFIEDPEAKKVLHYGCSDEDELANDGIVLRGWDHDTNQSEFLVYSDAKAYGLEAIAERRFPEFSGYKLIVVPELMKVAAETWRQENPTKEKLPAIFHQSADAQYKWLKRTRQIHYRHLSLKTLVLYNGADSDITKLIEIDNKKKVSPSLMRLYLDLSRVLHRMEPNGPLYDFEQHEKLKYLYPRLAKRLRRRIRQKLGLKKFNPGSPDQVHWALYEHFGYEFPFEGEPNTRKAALMVLGLKHKFPRMMLEYRTVTKVEGILEGYERSAKAHKGRLRTRWWSTGARTGRLSSGGEKKNKDSTIVNLQNIKKSSDIKNLLVADPRWREVYAAFLAIEANIYPDGKSHPVEDSKLEKRFENWVRENMRDLKTYLLYDYGQVEIRLLAQMSGDENLIKDCSESDIHTKVGVTMTGWDADRIRNDEETRTLTKNVHFGVVFSRGAAKGVFRFVQARSPADMRGRVTFEQVEEAIRRYFKRYRKVRAWIDKMVEFAREHKYVPTIFGMRQSLNVTDDQEDEASTIEYIDPDEVESRHSYWANQAVNGPVQGSAHQLMECGLVNLVRKSKKYAMLGIPPAEVHDALYFAVKVLELPEAYDTGKYLLEKESLNTVASDFPDIEWKVPIVVDAKAGLRLGGTVKMDAKTTIGGFLLKWFRLTKQQEEDLEKQIQEVSETDESNVLSNGNN